LPARLDQSSRAVDPEVANIASTTPRSLAPRRGRGGWKWAQKGGRAVDYYTVLRFSHIVGFILLGGGLLAVFVSELRAYRTRDIHIFAEAAWYTATFYDGLVLPGAIVVGLSGLFLTLDLGLGFFAEPWLVGMWGLFLFELIEGNTVTRVQFRRTLRRSRLALQSGELTTEHREEARTLLGQVTHFLDVPLFLVIVYCGAMRPGTWSHVLLAIVVALVAAFLLTAMVPRLALREPGSQHYQ
jgi:uncharacterized membrane protein